jgi:hypothetical protein
MNPVPPALDLFLLPGILLISISWKDSVSNVRSVKQPWSGRPRYSTFRLGRRLKCPSGPQFFRRDRLADTNVFQQGGLHRLKIDQTTQHVQQVE